MRFIVKKGIFLLFICLTYCSVLAQNPPLSGTYTIGGINPSFLLLKTAVDSLISRGISGPVVFNIRNGVYSERFSIPPITGASGTNTITFHAESGNAADVVIISPGGNKINDHHVIQLNGADHIILEALTVINTATGLSFGSGIHLRFHADSNIIRNCSIVVDSAYNTGGRDASGGIMSIRFAGIMAADTAANSPSLGINVKGKNGDYNLISNNRVSGQYGVILMGHKYGNEDIRNRVLNNHLRTANHGLVVFRNDTIEVSGNIIDTVKSRTVSGVYFARLKGLTFNFNTIKGSIISSVFTLVDQALISENTFEGSVYIDRGTGAGSYLISVSFGIRESIISNNKFLGSHKLTFDEPQFSSITGNRIEGGLEFYGSVNLSILNNYIKPATAYTGNPNLPGSAIAFNPSYDNLNLLIANNIIINPSVVISEGKNVTIVNNSFLGFGKADTSANLTTEYYSLDFLLSIGSATDLRILNNIFMQGLTGATFSIENPPRGVFEFDYNLFFTEGPVVGVYKGKEYATLNDVIRITGFCKNSLFGNPGFISNTDLHITKPLADGAGIPFKEIQVDYDQELRDTIHPDIGADEVQFPSSYDIGIASVEPLISPLGNVLVKIVLINKGNASLKDSVIRLSYSTDNGISWALPEQVKINSLVKFQDTASYTFLTPWNPSQAIKYNVCVRIESPGIVKDHYKENDQLCEDLCISLKAGVYTIDNSGAPADFNTISSAVAWLDMFRVCGIAGPIVFNIKPGTYEGKINIPFINGTSAVNTVTFQSATGNADDVIIVNNPVDDLLESTKVLYNVNVAASYVSLRNLTFISKGAVVSVVISKGVPQNAPRVLEVGDRYRSSHITISDCTIIVDTASWKGNSSVITGIFSFGGSGIHIENNRLFNGGGISLLGNNIYYDRFGINYRDDSTLIKGNKLYGTSGIEAVSSSNVMIRNNFLDNIVSHYDDGDNTAFLLEAVRNIIVDNNQILNATSLALIRGGMFGGALTSNLLFSNNTASSFKLGPNKVNPNPDDLTFPAVMVITGATKLRMLNNSISYMLPFIDHNVLIFLKKTFYNLSTPPPPPEEIELFNNIFYSTTGAELINVDGAAPYYGQYGSELNLTSDYNNWYQAVSNAGTKFGMFGNTSVPDFTSWKTITGQDKHSISVNPAFFNDSLDLHTLNPALDKKALYLDEVRNDMDYESRSNLNPDIGADEFVLDNIDLAVVDIEPKVGVLGDNTVTVTLSNEGLSSLNGKQVSLSFSPDSLNWSAPEVFTLSGLGTTHATEQIGFNKPYVINETIGNRLFVRINTPLVGDVYQLNEILKIDVCVSIRGTYAVGAGAPYFPDLKSVSDLLHDIPCGIQNPVVFELESGIYNEQISIPFIEGMSASNTITFRSKTGKAADVVITSGLNTAEGHYTVQVNRTGHVRIENLTIRNTGKDYASGIHLSDSVEDVLIKNCKISLDTTATSIKTNGILLSGEKDLNASGKARDIRIENNEIKGGRNGIRLNGLIFYDNKNIHINGNTIRHAYAGGIISEGNNIEEISGNKIYLDDRSEFDYGLQLSSDNAPFNISGNYFNKCGVFLDNCKPVTKAELSNNMIGGMTQNSIRREGVKLYRSTNIRVIYNSVYIEKRNLVNTTALQVTEGDKIELINNVFSNSWLGYAIGSDKGGISLSDYNDLYTTGNKLSKWEGTEQGSLAELKLAGGKEQHSLSVDPKFISADNLHTLSPDLDGKATPLAGLTLDYDGQLRSTGTPDIGADEYTLGLDAALTELISPAANQSITAGDVIEVKVKVTNTGNVVISNIPVSYYLGGQFQETVTLTGPLNAGASAELSFTKNWVPAAKGTVTLCAETGLVSDVNSLNNQYCQTYSVNEKLGKDGAVTEILSPASGQVLYEGEEITVKIKVSNPGNVTLTDVPVSYSINGNLVGSGTVTGSLAPAAVAEHEFTMKWTPSATGTIDLCATASVQDDIDALNDKKCGSWQVQEAIKIDGGVTTILSHLPNTIVKAGEEQTIRVRVKNFGNTAITDIPLSYLIEGEVIARDTIYSSISVNGTLDYIFKTKWVPAQKDTGSIEFCAQTNLPADVNLANDKTCIPITIKPGTTGLENMAISIYNLLIYPNPASMTIHLKWEEQAQTEPIQIRLYNSIGSCVLKKQVKGSEEETALSIGHLAEGMYILEVNAKGYLQREKIMITK